MIKVKVYVSDRINGKGNIEIKVETPLHYGETRELLSRLRDILDPATWGTEGYGGERISLSFPKVDLPDRHDLLEGWLIGKYVEPIEHAIRDLIAEMAYPDDTYEYDFPLDLDETSER